MLITGSALHENLEQTEEPVKWLRLGAPSRKISADMALAIAKGGAYEGKTNKTGRVLFIRELFVETPSAELPRDYWEDRAVIKFVESQISSPPTKIKNTERARRWDGMLKRVPSPLSWRREAFA